MIKPAVTQPFVSIVVPVYNGAGTIEESLAALSKSDYRNFEVLVVDDGSTDNTVEIAKKFPFKVIRKDRNTGAADSRNIGAEAAKGNIILFTDADCIVGQSTLAEIVRSFDNGADIVAGTYAKSPFDPDNIFSQFHSMYCYFNYLNSSKTLFGTHCAAIRKDLFQSLGGFDSSIKGATIEDLKFQYKLQSIKTKHDINMKAQVSHNSRNSFLKLLKGYYNRAKWASELLLEIKKLKPSKGGYIFNYTTVFSYASVLASIACLPLLLFSNFSIWPLLISLSAFLASKRKFYKLVEKKRRLAKIIPLSFLCDLTVLLGGFAGLLSYLRRKVKK